MVEVTALIDPRMMVEIEADAYLAQRALIRGSAPSAADRGPSGTSRRMPALRAAAPSATSARRCGRGRSGRCGDARVERAAPFLIAAAPGRRQDPPGARASRASCSRAGAVRRVVVVCPTAPLTRQWARAAARLGIHLAPDAELRAPPRDFDGVAVTYARVAKAGERWARQSRRADARRSPTRPTTSARTSPGARGSPRLSRAAPRWLLLSGTPFRSDATPIPGVRYDATASPSPTSPTPTPTPSRDGICRPVTFVPYDGALQWRSGDDVIESCFDDRADRPRGGRRYRTAISTELPDGLPRILREADARLQRCAPAGTATPAGSSSPPTASTRAQIAKLLREATGRAPVVVLHTEARAAAQLAAFTRLAASRGSSP